MLLKEWGAEAPHYHYHVEKQLATLIISQVYVEFQ